MMETKSKSRLWVIALLCLTVFTAVAFALTVRPSAATAETTALATRETEWLKPYGFSYADEADRVDGVATWKLDCQGEYQGYQVVNESDGKVMLDKGTNNPYTTNIEFDIRFEKICIGNGGNVGFTILADTNGDNYNKIGVRIFADKVCSMSWWNKHTEHVYSEGKKLSSESGITINAVDTVFHIVFGVRNLENNQNEIYFKMSERDGGAVWAEFTDTQPKDTASWTEYKPRILIGTQFEEQNEYSLFVSDPQYKSVHDIDNDEDISYFWNRNNNDPINLTYSGQYDEKLVSDISVPANSGVTWKMNCDNDEINMICFNMYNKYSANSYNFAVYRDKVVFTMRDGLNRTAGRYHGTDAAPYGDKIVEFKFEKAFIFTKDADYILKFSAQDVLNGDGAVVGRLLTYGIKAATASEFVSAQAFTSWVSPNSDDKIGVVLHATTAVNRTVTISSAGDAWYDIDYTDGSSVSKQKAKGLSALKKPSVTDKIFVGWTDGTNLYKAGDAYVGGFMKLTAVYIDEFYAPNVANLNMVSAKLRFTGRIEATSDVWTKLSGLFDKVEYVMKITPSGSAATETVKRYSDLSGGVSKSFTADTETDSADYTKKYAAQVYLRITYANNSASSAANTSGQSEIESPSLGAINSVRNIAEKALADTEKQWNTIERRRLEELSGRVQAA